MSGKCKHCWHFHVRGNSEIGTCRAGLTSVKKHRDDLCNKLKYYMPQRVEVRYTIHDRRGGTISGINDINDALMMCEESNRKIRKELMKERDIPDKGIERTDEDCMMYELKLKAENDWLEKTKPERRPI